MAKRFFRIKVVETINGPVFVISEFLDDSLFNQLAFNRDLDPVT